MLTPKQLKFANRYIGTLNATQSALWAGYSKKNAAELGYQTLNHPEVKAYIEEKQKQIQDSIEFTEEKLLKMLHTLAFADTSEMYNPDGTAKNIHDLSPETRLLISGMKTVEQYTGSGKKRKFVGTVQELKTYDRIAAAEKLMKNAGMFKKDNEQLKPELPAVIKIEIVKPLENPE